MHHQGRAKLTIVLLSVTCMGVAAADTIYVCVGGSGDYQNIQDAINAASVGDEIVVGPGTYCEHIDFLDKAVTVRSLCGPHLTIIDGEDVGGSVVRCAGGQGAETKLIGFTITRGGPSAPPNGGGGMYTEGSSPMVINCIFTDNRVSNGGAMSNYHDANPTLVNGVFWGNQATFGISNKGGAMMNYDSSPTLVNCTLAYNVAEEGYDPFGGGIASVGSSNPMVVNCILWGNTAARDPQFSGPATVTYSDVEGGWPGEGNIDADPLFADAASGDFHLLSGSPCIDAADNAAVPADACDIDEDGDTEEPLPFDLDGDPRLVDDPATDDTGTGTPPIVDMGAYEYQLEPLAIGIDIKPGSYPNSINLGSNGVVPVGILSDQDFDATWVDPDTVTLAGADVAVRGNGSRYMAHEEDVNADGLTDLVIQVETENLDPDAFQDGYAFLTGQTYEGQPFEGSDEITIVPE
jgi:hypothetical protein